MVIIFFIFFILTGIANSSVAGQNDVDFTSSNLPIIKIDTQGNTIENDERIVAAMEIIWNDNNERNYLTDPSNNYNGRIEIEYHGQSSLMFPKKSYRIETQDSFGENRNESLLGMPEENDWILYAPYSDKTLMRNVLAYKLAAEISDYAPRTKYCELVLNDEYRGVYVLTERIKRDKNRINITKMLPDDIEEPAVCGGYIFKIDKMDAGDNIIKLTSGLRLVIIEPKKDVIADGQTSWLKNHLNDFEDELYSSGNYASFIDVNSFVENLIIVELAKNIDGYRLSTYFHKDRDGKIIATPVWDYNLSFGNADYFYGWTPEGWYYSNLTTWDHNWWPELLKDPTFNSLSASRWAELRTNQLTKSHIFSLIDEWTILLQEAQQRNFIKYPVLGEYVWPNPGFPQSGSYGSNSPTSGGPVTYEEEITYMKDFIEQRVEWLDQQFGFAAGLQTDFTKQNMMFTLYQNSPNPFNASTKITYSISNSGTVTLMIFDLLGRNIQTLVNEFQEAGSYQINFDAGQLTSGIYFYRLYTGNKFSEIKKMILIR